MARRTPKPFLLRLDPQVYEALQRLARDEFRSVNGMVEWMLVEALRKRGQLKKERGG